MILSQSGKPSVIIEQADQCVYQAKESGRNCFVAIGDAG